MAGSVSATTVIAGASLALAAAGTAMSAIGSARQQEAAASAATYQAQVARNAQMVADYQAQDALKRGQVAEQERRQKTAQQIGAQRAALASSGTDVNTGSNADIQGDTASTGELDALTIRNNAEREAYDKKVMASNYAGEATLDSSKAANAISMEGLGVGANLLAGASSIADKWAVYKDKKILS